jgi:hypothetical protein
LGVLILKFGVPQKILEGLWGSANLFESILGSASTKRLKNTALEKVILKILFITFDDIDD